MPGTGRIDISILRGPDSAAANALPLATPAQPLEIRSAINETIFFIAAIRAETAVAAPSIRLLPFASDGASPVNLPSRLYRIVEIPLDRQPSWQIRLTPRSERKKLAADLLLPIAAPGAMPSRLPAGSTHLFWVEIEVPKGTSATTYSSRIEINAGDNPLVGIDLQLTVMPFVLPDDPGITLIGELEHESLFVHHVEPGDRARVAALRDWRNDALAHELDKLLHGTMRRLRKHDVTAVLPELAPVVRVEASGATSIDWGQYDAVAGPCLSGSLYSSRAPQRAWLFPTKPLHASIRSDRDLSRGFRSLAGDYLAQACDHFAQNRWLSTSYLALPAHEQLADLIANTASDELRILSYTTTLDLSRYGWPGFVGPRINDSVDILCPPGQYYDRAEASSQQSKGRTSWIQWDRPPFTGSTHAAGLAGDVLCTPWVARTLDVRTLVIGKINDWPEPEELAGRTGIEGARACLERDPHVLLYPGSLYGLTEPIASVRLKLLHRALQDASYALMLEEQGLDFVSQAVSQALCPYAGTGAFRINHEDVQAVAWPRDFRAYALAREAMGSMIESKLAGEETADRDRFTRSAAWRRLMLATRGATIECDGVRIRRSSDVTRDMWEISAALTLINNTRLPLEGMLAFNQLPGGWSARTEERRHDPIQPDSLRRIVLSATAPNLGNGAIGHAGLPVSWKIDGRETVEADARVSVVTSTETRSPPRIDGSLSDWPVGGANVATGFAPISGRSNATTDAALPQTFAMVQHDANALYVGVVAESARGEISGGREWRNTTVYEDQIPAGEELIELLFDPLNSGARSPSELYHVVVKRAGAAIFEKGIGFDPPAGEVVRWEADISVEVRADVNRWTAELRIPFSAFGDAVTETTVWGLNITRFDAGEQEFSTWSGAIRNAYDPLSLGNLVIPAPRAP